MHYPITIPLFFFFITSSCSNAKTEPITNISVEAAQEKPFNADEAYYPDKPKEYYQFNDGMIILFDNGFKPEHHQYQREDSFH